MPYVIKYTLTVQFSKQDCTRRFIKLTTVLLFDELLHKKTQNLDLKVNQQQNIACLDQQIYASPDNLTPTLLVMLETIRRSGSGLQLMGYDTDFRIGNFSCSILCMKDVTKRTASKACPTPLVLPVIHGNKIQMDHDIAFQVMVKMIAELATKMFIAISDNEFPESQRRHFLKAFIAKFAKFEHLSYQEQFILRINLGLG